MKYKHLSQTERYKNYPLMKAGYDQTQIAKLLDQHKSTISRELIRNTGSQRPQCYCIKRGVRYNCCFDGGSLRKEAEDI
jgi:IS30 family transposase